MPEFPWLPQIGIQVVALIMPGKQVLCKPVGRDKVLTDVILKFHEHPSMKKSAIRSYLYAANQALLQAHSCGSSCASEKMSSSSPESRFSQIPRV